MKTLLTFLLKQQLPFTGKTEPSKDIPEKERTQNKNVHTKAISTTQLFYPHFINSY